MYREFLANFACNLRRLSPPRLPVVYSLDRKTHAFAAVLGLSSVLLVDEEGDDAKPGAFEKDGPRSFNAITKRKIAAVKSALKAGLDVLLSDADIFWCGDAAKYLEELLQEEDYKDADVLIQPEANYRTLNSGFYFVKSGPHTLALFNQLLKYVDLGAHDQDVVNKVFCEEEYGGRKIHEPYGDVPFRCESHGAVIRVLPSQKFPSGAEMYRDVKVFVHSRSELAKMCKRGDFMVLHNNFIRASKKKARLVQKGMWFITFDNPEQPRCRKEPVPESAVAARTCGIFC